MNTSTTGIGRRILSMLLAFVMVFGMLPASALAEEAKQEHVHAWGDWTVTEPTCTEAGQKTRKCEGCGLTETESLEAKGHAWGDWTVTEEPSCTEPGSKERICAVCGEVDSAVIPAEHDWDEWVVTVNATCTAAGERVRVCKVKDCDGEETEMIPALGHSFGEWEIEAEPTCTEAGVKVRECATCGERETEAIPALGHSFGEWETETEPTCTAEGVKVRVCSVCKAEEREAIPALGHSFGEWEIETEPTCTVEGVKVRVCSVCKAEEREAIPALGHSFGEWEIETDPTCTAEGVKVRVCSVCKAEEHEAIPALGHSFGEWKVTTEATCTKAGEKISVCEKCGKEETEVIPALDHSFGDWKVTTEATCTKAGEKIRVCEKCGKEETEVIPALGHSFGEWKVTTEATCTEDGEKTRECSACGEKETAAIAALGHSFGEWKVTTEATCTKAGEKISVCEKCGKEETEVIPALGHSFGEWKVTTEATCTEDGEKTRECENCDVVETEVIPAPGHSWDVEDEDEAATCTECGEHREAKYNIIVGEERFRKVNEDDRDIETAEDWAAMFYSFVPTGDWAKDLLFIASTQKGYTGLRLENRDGEIKTYTRYGDWYGFPFESWCAMFISFCLNYAQVPSSAMPREASCDRWVSALSGSDKYAAAGTYSPKPGDLVFFDYQLPAGRADHVAIVSAYNEDSGMITVIEGAVGNTVASHNYSIYDSAVMGFGIMPENPELIVAEPEIITEIERIERTLTGKAGRRTVTVSGLLPEDATLQIVSIPADAAQAILEAQGGSEYSEIVVAFDISILSGGEKYDLEEYGDSIAVSVSGISDAEMATVTHVKIDFTDENGALDQEQIRLAQTTKVESETLYTETEGSSVFFDLSSCSGLFLSAVQWPEALLQLAEDNYGGENPANNPLFMTITGPTDTSAVRAGDTRTYKLTYGFGDPVYWTTSPYSFTQPLFNEYKNISLTITLPEGVLLNSFGGHTFTSDPADRELGVSHTYTINVDSSHPSTAQFSEDNVSFVLYFGNNGNENSLSTYDLSTMATLSAQWTIVDQNSGTYYETYGNSVTVGRGKVTTVTDDIWGVGKARNGPGQDGYGVVVEGDGTVDGTVTLSWKIDVGMMNGGSMITDSSKYNRHGRDAVEYLDLTDSLSAKLGTANYETAPVSVTMKKSGGSAVDITGVTLPIRVWGPAPGEDEDPVFYNTALRLNTIAVDSNGDVNEVPDVDTPCITTYEVTAVYKLTPEMYAEFYESAKELKVTNSVSTEAKLANVEEKQLGNKDAENKAVLPLHDPAVVIIEKWIQTLTATERYGTGYINKYGQIDYQITMTSGDENASFKIFTKSGDDYSQVGDSSSSSDKSVTVQAGTYYLVAGDSFSVEEKLSSVQEQNMKLLSIENATFTTAENGSTTVKVTNLEKRGKVTIIKVNDRGNRDTALAGATFRLYLPDGVTDQRAVLDDDASSSYYGRYYLNAEIPASGEVTVNDLPFGTYNIIESVVPAGYAQMANQLPDSIVIEEGDGQVHSYTVKNEETRAQIKLEKYVGRQQASVNDFTKVADTSFPATFELQYFDPDPDNGGWKKVEKQVDNSDVPTTLSSSGEISAWVPAKFQNGDPISYRFVETITGEYYPVVLENGVYKNKPGETTANSPEKTLTIGSETVVKMYNRQNVTIQVFKNFYHYTNLGRRSNGEVTTSSGTRPASTNMTVKVKLWRTASTKTDANLTIEDLEQVGEELVALNANPPEGTTGPTTAKWTNLPVYDANGNKYRYFISEDLSTATNTVTNAAGYVLGGVDTSQQGNRIVKIPADSSNQFVAVTFGNNTINATARLYNYQKSIAMRVIKEDYRDHSNHGITGCTFSVYTDSACTQVAYDSQTGKKLENLTIPAGTTGYTFFLEEKGTYYYKEIKPNGDYVFAEIQTDNSTFTNASDGKTIGVIDLSSVEHVQTTTGNHYHSYTIWNKKTPTVTIEKRTMGRQVTVTGAKFAVYTKNEQTGQFSPYLDANNNPVVFDLSSSSSANKALPSGTYYIAETKRPDPEADYLNPNSVKGCAEYNRVATLYNRKVNGTDQITYEYDAATGLTFTKIEVPDSNTATFTFYNIYVKEKVKVQKTIDGADAAIAGFKVEIYNEAESTTEPVGYAWTDSEGVAYIDGLPIYNSNGDRIVYTVREGAPSTWDGGEDVDLAAKYYLVHDGQTFVLEVQTSGSDYNYLDNTPASQGGPKRLTVDNATSITIKVTKQKMNGWMTMHNLQGFADVMDGVTISLYRRPVGGTEWTWVADQNTVDGQVSFSEQPREVTPRTDPVQKYEYALVERASNSSVYDPYKAGFKQPLPSGNYDPLTDLSPYNYLILSADQISTGTEYDLSSGDAPQYLQNASHWVQFHVTKYEDDHNTKENKEDDAENGRDVPTVNDGFYDADGHAYNISDADRQNPLDDCVFSLYRFEIKDSDTSVVFNPRTWKLIGTYTSGTLYDMNGNRKEGMFMTDVDEGEYDEDGNLVKGISRNYVYMLVEENVGPNGVYINPHYQYQFWYNSNHPVTCTYSGGEVRNCGAYNVDSVTYAEGLNTPPPPDEGGTDILLAALRLAKWRDSYDEYGNRRHQYTPLNNVHFEMKLPDGTVISSMTTGLDGNSNYSFAQSGTFQLVWGKDENEGKIFLREYELPGGASRDYDVTSIVVELQPAGSPWTYYGVPVNVYETGAPEGYGYSSMAYETYLVFVNKNESGTQKYRYFNDLYLVKVKDTPPDVVYTLAETQNGRTWYVTNANSDEVIAPEQQGQLRIVDYPMNNTSVVVHKVRYTPSSQTIALGQSTTAETSFSELIATGNYNAKPMARVEMMLERYDDETSTWKNWDAMADGKGAFSESEFRFRTDETGNYMFTYGLPQGHYRISETDLGDYADSYENAYPGNGGYYREFYVGGVARTVFMANPEKISLTIKKTDMSGTAIKDMVFHLGSLSATTDSSGKASFGKITSGVYTLSEEAPQGNTDVNTNYFKLLFAKQNPGLAALVSESGMRIGLSFGQQSVSSESLQLDNDVVVKSVTPDGGSSTVDLSFTVKNPVNPDLKLRKIKLGDDNTKLNASFQAFYLSFDKIPGWTDDPSGTYTVSLPDAAETYEATRTIYEAAGWTVVSAASGSTGSSGVMTKTDLYPGVYAFYEKDPPTGYERLYQNNKVVVYSAVLTGGIDTHVSVEQNEITIDGNTYPISFTHTSSGGAATVEVVARNIPMAPLTAQKKVIRGDSRVPLGDWTVELKIYDSAQPAGGRTDDTGLLAVATISKGDTQVNVNGQPLIYFMQADDQTKRAYFSVGKDYYLEEEVVVPDAANLLWLEYEIDDLDDDTANPVVIAEPGGCYKISITGEAGFSIIAKNLYLYGRVDFVKRDNDQRTMLLPGAGFEVRHQVKNDQGQMVWEVIPGATVTEEKNAAGEGTGKYTAVIPLDSVNATNYRIYEISPPDGYVLDPDENNRYIEVELKMVDDGNGGYTGNYVDLTASYDGENHETIYNTDGNDLIIQKFNNVKGASDLDFAPKDKAKFAIYHRIQTNPDIWKNVWEDYITDNQGKTDSYTMTPHDAYAVEETWFDPDLFSGTAGIYLKNGTTETLLTPTEITVQIPGSTDTKKVMAVVFEDVRNDITLTAYNVPYIKPTIAKVDVGGYPVGVRPAMDFMIYEISAADYALLTDNDTSNDDSYVEGLAAAAAAAQDLPRLAYGGTGAAKKSTSASNPFETTIDGVTCIGTSAQWASAEISERWDATKYYVLVETEIRATTSVDYDTMVKDDSDVVWWLAIGPDPNPSKTTSPTFILQNINGVADVTVKKTVLEKGNAQGVPSDVENNKLESLLKDPRTVAYTIEPTVTGKNQMLSIFRLEENGLTCTPTAPDAAVIDYSITNLFVGKALQNSSDLEAKYADKTFTVSAVVTFTLADGTTESTAPFDVTADAPAAGVEPVPANFGTVPVTVPLTAKTFTVEYYSSAVRDVTGYSYVDEDHITGYSLAEEFMVGPSTVCMNVKKTVENAENPAVEVASIINTTTARLTYPKWGADGSGPVLEKKSPSKTATVQVKPVSLPILQVSKKNSVEDTSSVATVKTGDIIQYTIEVKNISSDASFIDPVVLDILPTGVTYYNKAPSHLYAITRGTQNEEFRLTTEGGPIITEGDIVQNTSLGDARDAETAVTFMLEGELKPGSSFKVSFYALVTENALLYETASGVKVHNDAYISSSKPSYHTTDNPYGYPYLISDGADGYMFGQQLTVAADNDPLHPNDPSAHDPMAAIHEEGVRGYLPSGFENANTFVWVKAHNELDAVLGSSLSIVKDVKGDRDTNYHQELGKSSRTTYYEDDPDAPADFRQGGADWRLTISNGQTEPATNLVIGDVIPKKGDDSQKRGSVWDMVFDSISTVAIANVAVNQNKYTVWYYILPTQTLDDPGVAKAALERDMPNCRITGDGANAGDVDEAYLLSKGWTKVLPATKTEREKLYAFMIVFDKDTPLPAGHSLVITYHTTVKAVPDNHDFDQIAYQNAVNNFFLYYEEYPLIKTSNPVSVTLVDQYVRIEGDVWIDEDWTGRQLASGNRRPYEMYAIIHELVGAGTVADPTSDPGSINFSITDKREKSTQSTVSEDKNRVPEGNAGTATNRAYGESIRHFIFSSLDAALDISAAPLYSGSRLDDEYANKPVLNPASLKGDDPNVYALKASISNSALMNIFQLSTPLGTYHYYSADPDSELTGSNGDKDSLDNNFFTAGSASSFGTNPFYVRYSDDVDQSKDIGFRMVRGLVINKVAQDDPNNTPVPNAKFKIYGPFNELASTSSLGNPLKFKYDGGVYTLDPSGTVTELVTDASGKIHVVGLNWWKEYVVEESSPAPGYTLTGTTATALDPVPSGGWTGRDEIKGASEAYGYAKGYEEFVVLTSATENAFRFRLKLPATERTSQTSSFNIRIENPRGADFEFQKVGEQEYLDGDEYKIRTVPLNGITFGLYTAQTCADTEKLILNGAHVTATSATVKDASGNDVDGVVSFKQLPYGTYYMKEISVGPWKVGDDSIFWDNTTIYEVFVDSVTNTVSLRAVSGSAVQPDSDPTRTGMLDPDTPGYTIINKLARININGSKVWVDDQVGTDLRPSPITINLYRDGGMTPAASVEADKEHNYAWAFNGLLKYNYSFDASGNPVMHTFVYTVDESAVPYYTSSVDGYVITNRVAGALQIKKFVLKDDACGEPNDTNFTIKITLKDSSNNPVVGKFKLKQIEPTEGTASQIEWTVADGGVKTITMKANESWRILGLPLGTQFTIEEILPQPTGWTLKEITPNNGTNKLIGVGTITENNKVIFSSVTNTYEAEGSITFDGTKAMVGHDLDDTYKFQFALYKTDEDYNEIGDALETVWNNADGSFSFHARKYILNKALPTDPDEAKWYDGGPGTYYYKVVEIANTVQGVVPEVEYDQTVYKLKVVVADNGQGTLVATRKDTAGAIQFVNTVGAVGAVPVTGVKTLNGRPLNSNGGEFSFKLTKNGSNKLNSTVTNDGAGNFNFGGIVYEIVSAADKSITLKETYRTDLNSTTGGTELSSTVLKSSSVDLFNGNVYTTTFTYKVEELVPTTLSQRLPGVTYNPEGAYYTVTVTLSYNKSSGVLTVISNDPKSPKIEKHTGETVETVEVVETIAYVNTYEAVGDIRFSGTKILTGKTLTGGEFSFELYKVVGTAETKLGPSVSNGNGTAPDATVNDFEFSKLIYELTTDNDGKLILTEKYEGVSEPLSVKYYTEGVTVLPEETFNYVIKEVVPETDPIEGVVYSVQTFQVTVTVKDNGNGTLSVTKVLSPDPVEFINTPVFTHLDGTKTWDDADNQDGKRPETITITLMRKIEGSSGAPVMATSNDPNFVNPITVTITDPDDPNNWTWSFQNLPVYAPGTTQSTMASNKYEYSVVEDVVSYTVIADVPFTQTYDDPVYQITPPDETHDYWTSTVINRHAPEPVDIFGEKIWDDDDDLDKIRPESITITLMSKIKDSEDEPQAVKPEDVVSTYPAGKTFENPITVTAAEDFKWSFTDLPRYRTVTVSGTVKHLEIEYSFSEAEITYPDVFGQGYSVKYTPQFNSPALDKEGTFHRGYWSVEVTNTHEPEAIPFSLYKFGQVVEDGVIQNVNKPLKGVTFTLYTDEDCKNIAEMIVVDASGVYSKVPAVVTSDENGFVDFGQINFKITKAADGTYTYEAMTYYLKETGLGDDNKDSYWDNDTIYQVVAAPRVLNADGTVKTPASVKISVLKDQPTNADGDVYTGVLTNDATIVIGDAQLKADKIDNDLAHYKIRIVKIDYADKTTYDKTTFIEGAKFDLYRAPDPDTSGTDTSGTDTTAADTTATGTTDTSPAPAADGTDGATEDHAPRKLPSVKTVSGYTKLNTTSLVTGKDGIIDLGDLLPGTYYLVETEAPVEYYKLDEPVEIIVEKDKVTLNYNIVVIDGETFTNTGYTQSFDPEQGQTDPITFTIFDQPKYGKLQITKYLNYYKAGDSVTFYFNVVGTLDKEGVTNPVYSQIAVLSLDGTNTASTVLDYIPAGAHIVVTELYSGERYELDSVDPDGGITTIVANDTVSVNFTNKFNWEDIDGHGLVNIFVPDASSTNGWKFSNSYPTTPTPDAALPAAPVTAGGDGNEGENGGGDDTGNGKKTTSGGGSPGGGE